MGFRTFPGDLFARGRRHEDKLQLAAASLMAAPSMVPLALARASVAALARCVRRSYHGPTNTEQAYSDLCIYFLSQNLFCRTGVSHAPLGGRPGLSTEVRRFQAGGVGWAEGRRPRTSRHEHLARGTHGSNHRIRGGIQARGGVVREAGVRGRLFQLDPFGPTVSLQRLLVGCAVLAFGGS